MGNNEFEKGTKFSYSKRISYSEKAVVSKQVIKNEAGSISLFAFDKGEGLTEHTSPYDAVVQIVEGKADIMIKGVSNILETGDTIIMPANVPHSLTAVEKFKMVLTMIKGK